MVQVTTGGEGVTLTTRGATFLVFLGYTDIS